MSSEALHEYEDIISRRGLELISTLDAQIPVNKGVVDITEWLNFFA